MSQALQQNPSTTMVRHADFLATAEALKPQLHRAMLQPRQQVIALPDVEAIHGWRAEDSGTLEEFYGRELNSGDSVILDFGTHCVGHLSLRCHAVGSPPDAPAHIRLTFGETLSEVTEPFSEYEGWLCRSWLQQHDEFIDLLPATLELSRRYCLRYLKIEVVAVSRKYRLCVDNVTLTTVSSAPAECLPCHSADPLLRQIDAVSVHTLRNCMQDVFEDGPKRDRRLWLGDLRLQALVNDVTFARHDLVRRCLYLFAGNTREDGMLSANIFVQPEVIADDTFLFDYALFFIDVLFNYLSSTGDKQTAQELWPTAWRQVELALERCDTSGIVRDDETWWSFIDWHDELNKQAASQGVLIFCLERALSLAKDYDVSKVALLTKTLERLKTAAYRAFWDETCGFYVSGAHRQISCASQVWLVLADVGSAEQQRQVMQRLLAQPPEIGMNTPYLRHHFIAALLKTGLQQQAVTEIKAYWGAMVKYGADTFWELYDPQRPEYSPYGSKIINSYCHAWSCTPAWFIRQYGL
ncbi:sugar hydrolase [Phytobacter diazotrophicus]|uniref:alpha-L-rhamnosidase-related protein n=1 Tax=Phytobacter diazotrophicus TaxID=395631 RepID=UPI002FF5D1F1